MPVVQWYTSTASPLEHALQFSHCNEKRIGASYPTYPPFRMIQRLKIYLKPILLLASNYNLNLVTGTITEGHLALKPLHMATLKSSQP